MGLRFIVLFDFLILIKSTDFLFGAFYFFVFVEGRSIFV